MFERPPKAGWFELLLYRLGRRLAFSVAGDSMVPTLRSGDIVLIRRTDQISAGDVVLVNHPYKSGLRMLKRIDSIDGNGAIELRGDNPTESTDSRSFGSVSRESVIGRVVSVVG